MYIEGYGVCMLHTYRGVAVRQREGDTEDFLRDGLPGESVVGYSWYRCIQIRGEHASCDQQARRR